MFIQSQKLHASTIYAEDAPIAEFKGSLANISIFLVEYGVKLLRYDELDMGPDYDGHLKQK